MSQLDALRLIHSLRERLVEFSIEECYLRDERLRDITRRVWSGPPHTGGLLSDVWVEAAFGARTADEVPHTLREMTDSGEFARDLVDHLDARGAVPRDRPLYSHQLAAIRAAMSETHERPAVMVTAGTGAGKTESFLLPILDELWRQPRVAGESGVRCIVLYPMNALVNDQVDRLYSWLRNQNRVTLFHFTSETPEDHVMANRIGVPRWEPCRFRTRRQARGLETVDGRKLDPSCRGTVPDILITNYSMLEYMLCRPQDAVLFGPALRSLVLDEAHLYTGTLAAEISLLLRRVLARCRVPSTRVLQIGTSATLGEGDLAELGSLLFTKPRDMVRVVRGEKQRPSFAQPVDAVACGHLASQRTAMAALSGHVVPTMQVDADGEPELNVDHDDCARLAASLRTIAGEDAVRSAMQACHGRPAVLLHTVLTRSPIVHKLGSLLWDEPRLSLLMLAERLWGDRGSESIEATVTLLRLSASARMRAAELPLVPHRLHVLCKSPDGMVLCLNPACSGPAEVKPEGWGALSTGFTDNCPHCRCRTLSLVRCEECGDAAVAGIQTEDFRLCAATPDELAAARDTTNGHSTGVLMFSIQAVPPDAQTHWHVNLDTGELGGAAARTRALAGRTSSTACPACDTGETTSFEPIVGPVSLTLSVVTETVLAELPEHPSPDRHNLPARGRRLLAFTDSRQGAARLGPRLTGQHETQVLRAAIARVVGAAGSSEELVHYLEGRIYELEARLGSAPPQVAAAIRRDLFQARADLSAARDGLSISDLVECLREAPQIKELLDPDTAERHQHSPEHQWCSTDWSNNADAVRATLRRRVCEELAIPLRPHRATSGEAQGLIEILLPRSDLFAIDSSSPFRLTPPFQAIERTLSTMPRTLDEGLRRDWRPFVTELVLDLRRNMAATLGEGSEVDEDFVRELVGIVAVAGLHITRAEFVGETERSARLARVAELLRRGGVTGDRSLEAAKELLGGVFDLLLLGARGAGGTGELRWLEANDEGGIRLNISELCVRRPSRLFFSAATGLVYPRSVLGQALMQGVRDLQPMTFDEAIATPRLARRRRELLGDVAPRTDLFAMGLWGEEHSAQLSPQENLRLQNLFRAGARNVLSSTTTLELGIDIGGLAGVLLTDVPPGVANYLQRAGRAGRRTDGSSIVVTFARPRPFDREVFQRFDRYLSKAPPTPNVFLDRQRIAVRHAHAFLLGEFFRAVYPTNTHVGAMTAYRLMGEFCGVPATRNWDTKSDLLRPDAIPPRPAAPMTPRPSWYPEAADPAPLRGVFHRFLEHLAIDPNHRTRTVLLSLLAGTPLEPALRTPSSDAMSEFIRGAGHRLDEADADWRARYGEMYDSWQRIDARDSSASGLSNALHRNLEAMYTTTTIEALADGQYLPRYGFPVGLQRLAVWSPDARRPQSVREEDRYRLERSGMLALREYAPGATLVVGGNVVRCRGLMKHWTGVDKPETLGLRGRGLIGPQGRFVYRIGERDLPDTFPSSGESTRFGHRFDLLFPRHGFSTAWWDRPARSRSLEDPVGSVQMASSAVIESNDWDKVWTDFAGVSGLVARYKECGELLVYNPGNRAVDPEGRPRFTGFAICTRCGFSEVERKPDGQGRIDLPSSFDRHRPLRRMERKSSCWQGIEGAPVLRHQVLAARQITDVLVLEFGQRTAPPNAEVVKTVAEALRLAGARCLQLDPRELGAKFHPVADGGFGIVLFDCHPGGAGHVLELANAGEQWLWQHLIDVLFVSEEHDQRCRSGCLDCLRTFGEPGDLDGIELDRPGTLAWLRALRSE